MTTPHWKTSNTPYFAIVTDSNTIKYPEIQYVFQDDPLYDQYPEDPDDAIVVQLDAKGEVKKAYSLSDQCGVLEVRIKGKETKRVEIDIMRSRVDQQLEVPEGVEGLKGLVELYGLRMAQLGKVFDS